MLIWNEPVPPALEIDPMAGKPRNSVSSEPFTAFSESTRRIVVVGVILRCVSQYPSPTVVPSLSRSLMSLDRAAVTR